MTDNKDKLSPALKKEVERQLALLEFGTAEITPRDEFVKMLAQSIESKTPLRVKCGIDPTVVDVHLGHTVPYRKMRQFQDLGHQGVVILGDYTASIGDPTGRNESRPALTQEQVSENAKHYMEQVYQVVDPDKTEVRLQSEWFNDFSLRDIISYAAQTTVAKLMSHETFRDRLNEGHPLALHELFYPVLQGVDSLFINADVELGGTDQKFNVLMGRDYQRSAGKRPQVAMLLPIIRGTCGQQKMSKSLGNYISLKDTPFDKFGKIMSVPDALMEEYYRYVTGLTPEVFEKILSQLKSGQLHPNEAKKRLAVKIVELFHGGECAQEMREKFEAVFKKKEVPDDAPEFKWRGDIDLVSLLVQTQMVKSKGEGRRMVAQNAVGIVDGAKLANSEEIIDASYKGKVIKVGKRRFLRVV